MLNREGTIYMDIEKIRLQDRAAAFYFRENQGQMQNVIYTGKIISAMPIQEKAEKAYEILANDYDVHFIFEDSLPDLSFYPVPMLEIFAVDSCDGCFGTTCSGMSILDQNAPIYYIDKNLKSYYLAENLREFISIMVSDLKWRKRLGLELASVLNVSKGGKDYLTHILGLKHMEDLDHREKEIEERVMIFSSYAEAAKFIDFEDWCLNE